MQFKYVQDNASLPILIQRELYTMYWKHRFKREDTQQDAFLLDWCIWEIQETMSAPEFIPETHSKEKLF